MYRLVTAHFAGKISPANERALREHLPECDACRRYYERQLLLAELDPCAWTAEDRLAHGLGLPAQRPPARRWDFTVVLAAAALAACALWLVPRLSGSPRANEPAAFAARGDGLSSSAALFVYRLHAGEPPALVEDRVSPKDELAFAYVNPAGFEHLLVFGIDEHHHVFWYHPAWSNAADDPVGVSVVAGRDVHELPEAVRQDLDGGTLQVIALFTHDQISVRTIERELESRWRRGASLAGIAPGGFQTELSLRVERP
jgi:hypothetical protein